MRISEASEKSGLGIDTIRFYEKSGLLPQIARGTDGQRRFTAENVEWLTLLYWLRQTGMPIKTMQRFAVLYQAGDQTIAERKSILLNHSAFLKQRRKELDHCDAILAHKIQIYEEFEK